MQHRVVANAQVAHQRRQAHNNLGVSVGSTEAHRSDSASHESWSTNGDVLLSGQFTLALSVGASVRTRPVKVRTAAQHFAIAQQNDASVAIIDTILCAHHYRIETIPDHEARSPVESSVAGEEASSTATLIVITAESENARLLSTLLLLL